MEFKPNDIVYISPDYQPLQNRVAIVEYFSRLIPSESADVYIYVRIMHSPNIYQFLLLHKRLLTKFIPTELEKIIYNLDIKS